MSATDPEASSPRAKRRKRKPRSPGPSEAAVLTYGTASRPTPAAGGALAAASLLAAAAGGLYFVDPLERIGAGATALLVAVVSLVRQGVADRFTRIALDPTTGVLTLTASDGTDVDLPPGTVSHVECFRHVATSTSDTSTGGAVNQRVTWKLGIHKRDGGYLEALSFPEHDGEEAREAAKALRRALARIPETDPAGGDATDLLEVLRAARAIEATTSAPRSEGYRSAGAGEAVELAWGAPTTLPRMGAALAAIAGMGLVFLGFSRTDNGGGALIGAWFMAAIGVIALLGFGSTLGVRIHVRVDDETLSVERRRFGRRADEKRWPIDRVQAIDFSMGAAGASGLAVRLSEDDAPPKATTAQDKLGLIGAVIGHALRARTIPTGALTITQCVQLDLALSAEVARRKRVQAGEV